MKMTAILISTALALIPQVSTAFAQDRGGRHVERSHRGGAKPFIVRRHRDDNVRNQRTRRHHVAPRRHHVRPCQTVRPNRHIHRHVRPRTVIKVRPTYRRWHPGAPRTVIAVPSVAIGARLGWCHYHRFPVRGWKAHKIVRCHRHHPWNAPGIAYVGIR